MAKLSAQDITHLVQLANLQLSDDEIQDLVPQMQEIVGYIESFRDFDVSSLSGTARTTEEENITRNDEVRPSLTQDQALANARDTHEGFFKVPAVLNQ